MIDLHCHLHFGCDDGPKGKSDAVDLAKALVDAGVPLAEIQAGEGAADLILIVHDRMIIHPQATRSLR